MKRKEKKSKGKAAGGDRYDVMLTGGGGQKIAGRESSTRCPA
jgi:hypothetical protein